MSNPVEEILCQCAEECTELAQACLKMRRVLNGTTVVTIDRAAKNISEEIGDVLNCIDVIREVMLFEPDVHQRADRMFAWADRISKWIEREAPQAPAKSEESQ